MGCCVGGQKTNIPAQEGRGENLPSAEFALKRSNDAHPYWEADFLFIPSIDSNVNLF